MSQRYIGGVVTETTDVAKAPWTGSWTQQAALQGFAGAQAPLRIANSLRFRSSASAYLNRTPSVAGNRQTWTWSGWVKRGALGAAQILFGAAASPSGSYFRFESGDTLRFYDYNGSTFSPDLITTQVFRDPSSWYHIVLVSDTTQATSTNRVRMYVNGVQITAFSTATYPAQNAQNTSINNTYPTTIGAASATFDGYLAEINFIDGQALTPSSFGQYDANGVWQPKAYTGTYGTNGFRLNFSNGTSTTTLGNDSSGRGNNWTTNNISLTAGATYDWMIDSPTPYPGSSYGVGNYCVLNPLDRNTNCTTSDGNLLAAFSATSSVRASIGVASGLWYYETVLTGSTANNVAIMGYMSASHTLSSYPASSSFGVSYYGFSGQVFLNGGTLATGLSTAAQNDIISVAVDLSNNKIWFAKNGSWMGTGTQNPASNQGGYDISSRGSAAIFPAIGCGTPAAGTAAMNFGQRPFAYTPPSGFKSLCTQNLPNVSIYNGAQYMAATTYTGTGSSVSIANTVNGVSFQPDFVWIKSRSAATDHALYDVIRGTQNRLESNTTDAAVASDNGLTAFGSSGFTVNTLAQVNTSSATYVGWQWKAGGTAVTNTAGSITSQVSANTTAGFSVVTYTGTGANATVGHGLGVAPSMIIVKRRDAINGWVVGTNSIGWTNQLQLESTAAVASYSGWNSTNPTSSVFSVFTNGSINASAGTYVAYCFAAIAGYSAFGSYTGNGSTDGPFVYCGFRPRFVMVKRTDASDSWGMFDSSRDAYNAENALLRAESSNAEASMSSLVGNPFGDFLSNGFKVRNTSTIDNAFGTYIYAAFAENPFQNALAR